MEPQNQSYDSFLTIDHEGASPLLRRAFLFLEDGDWTRANEYCEKVLDLLPEAAPAYLGKMMAELQVRRGEDLKNLPQPFDAQNNYEKVLRFGSEELKSLLQSDVEFIKTRNETARLESLYSQGKTLMDSAQTQAQYQAAAETFAAIPGFQDADDLHAACLERAEVCRKDEIYVLARQRLAENTFLAQKKAEELFCSIPGWRDADDLIPLCQQRAAAFQVQEQQAAALQEQEQQKAAALQAQKAKKKKGKIVKRVALIVTPILVLALAGVLAFVFLGPLLRYNKAVSLLKDGEYEDAYFAFLALGDYKDCEEYVERFDFIYDEYKTIDADGKIERHCKYTYDDDLNLLKEIYIDSDGDQSTFEYTYNKKGEIEKYVYTGSSGSPSVTKYRYAYDSDGNMIRKEEMDEDGSIEETYEFTYDSDGNMIKERCFGRWSEHEYTYDSDGNVVKEVYSYSDGDESVSKYTYDSDGNLIKKVFTYSDGDESVTKYTYDSDGNLTKEIHTYSDRDESVTKYTYDSNDRLIQINYSSPVEEGEARMSYHDNGTLAELVYESEGDKEFRGTETYNEYGLLIHKVTEYDGEEEETSYEYKNIRVIYNEE